ncbi:MAG: hypothetical protein LUC86_08645 [Prevotellaceae bacterium]|nr:hypothetical protein [Prevotellaceae bacterium]
MVLNALSVDERGRTSPTLLTRHVSRYLSHPSSLRLRALLYGVWTPWSRMVSRSLVTAGGLRFDETPVGNDAMFVLRASSLARRVEVESSVCYHYYQPLEGSQTWAQYKPETFLVRLELRLRVNQFYRSVGYPFLWPLRRMMRQARLLGLSAEAARLLRRYRHTILTELRSSLSQLAGKMLGYL